MLGPRRCLIAGGVITTLLLALAIPQASARNLRISWGFLKWIWSGMHVQAAGTDVSCQVTLEGSFHSASFAKLPHIKVGNFDRAALAAPCTGGTATILTANLPWRLSYEAFVGVLPQIVGARMLIGGLEMRIDPEGILPACLMRTAEAFGEFLLNREGTITGFRLDESIAIPLAGGFGCGVAEATLSGTATVTRAEGGIPLAPRISLI
jgi:hypothetical protein